MNWLEKIRSMPHKEKTRLVWIIVIVTTVVLVTLWVITAKINKNVNKDTSLFQTISRGFKDLKENYKK